MVRRMVMVRGVWAHSCLLVSAPIQLRRFQFATWIDSRIGGEVEHVLDDAGNMVLQVVANENMED